MSKETRRMDVMYVHLATLAAVLIAALTGFLIVLFL